MREFRRDGIAVARKREPPGVQISKDFEIRILRHLRLLNAGTGVHVSILFVGDPPVIIGALSLAVARDEGVQIDNLSAPAMLRTADLHPGEAKNDARDAAIITHAARSMPHALRSAWPCLRYGTDSMRGRPVGVFVSSDRRQESRRELALTPSSVTPLEHSTLRQVTTTDASRSMQERISAIALSIPRVSWSIHVVGGDGQVLGTHRAGDTLWTASVGKLFLLTEVAHAFELRPELRGELLHRNRGASVGEAGIWQRMLISSLPFYDVAVLAACVSDNLATNVLLDRIGIDRVQALSISLGFVHSTMLDRVRQERGEDDPQNLSQGSAGELAHLMELLYQDRLISSEVSATLRLWLSLNADLSMVASPFGFDPLAHEGIDARSGLCNKTGSDNGVKAETGIIRAENSYYIYAVAANWPPERMDLAGPVIAAMRRVGVALRAHIDQH